MPDVSSRVRELRTLENLAAGQTIIHRIHPSAKLISSCVFIVFTASVGRYDFIRLAPFLFYPSVLTALAELPYKPLLARVFVALPFCLFTGVSNMIIDTSSAFIMGNIAISYGAVSLATILLKMYLCVMAATLLIATIPFSELTAQLRRFRIPATFVTIFEIVFRYISVLLEEVYSMTTAYKLRSGGKKALDARHIGSFAGQLVIRGFERAERVHAAMSCRGYSLGVIQPSRVKFRYVDFFFAASVCIFSIIFRFISIG